MGFFFFGAEMLGRGEGEGEEWSGIQYPRTLVQLHISDDSGSVHRTGCA